MNHRHILISLLLLAAAIMLIWHFGKDGSGSEHAEAAAQAGVAAGAAVADLSATSTTGLGSWMEAEKIAANASAEPRQPGALTEHSSAVADLSIQVQDIGMTLPPSGDHVMREQVRTMEPGLRELGQDFGDASFRSLTLPLFDSRVLVLEQVSHRATGGSGGVFTGRVPGEPHGGHVVLSYVNDAVAATIHLPGRGEFYEIRTAPDARSHVLSQLDPAKMPPCGHCLQDHETPDP